MNGTTYSPRSRGSSTCSTSGQQSDTDSEQDTQFIVEISNKLKSEPEWDPDYILNGERNAHGNDRQINIIGHVEIQPCITVKSEPDCLENDELDFQESQIIVENIKTEEAPEINDNSDVDANHNHKRTKEGSELGSSSEERRPRKTARRKEKQPQSDQHLQKKQTVVRRLGRFECDICCRVFGRKDQLHVHMRIHTGDKPYGCSTCGKHFRTNGNLTEHLTTHSDVRPFACDLNGCKHKCKTKGQLMKHKKTHDQENRKNICEICNKSFLGPFFLRKHQELHTKKPFGCKICSKSFRDEVSLQVHKKMHDAEMTTNNTQAITMHKYRLMCTVCGKKFTQNRNLEKHMFRHTDVRAFQCTICSKSFKRRSTLDEHVHRVHSGKEKSVCPVCGKQVRALNCHMSVHKEERPFSCDACDWSFKSSAQLKAHVLAVHEGGRNHSCDQCKKAFKNVHHLRRHVRMTHSEDKPYKCDLCGKQYSDKWCLGAHITRFHQNK